MREERRDGKNVRGWLARAMAMKMGAGNEDEEGGLDFSGQQREAVERGVEVVGRYGGVVLADAVGLGKTRVACGMARRLVSLARRRSGRLEPVLVVAPARLRKDWERAISESGWQVGRDAEVVSHHSLSRKEFGGRPAVVVVDEAHKFRNPGAKRSQNLARITARSPSILVTATPVCTRRRDLRELLGYFLGDDHVKEMVGMGLDAAFAADEAGEFDVVEILEEVVIRRKDPDFGVGGRPGVKFEILHYEAADDEAWLWQNLEATLRGLSLEATGKFWPRGLMISTLLKMWESGPGALSESLWDLLHFHERWLEAARVGGRVERPEFRTLFGAVDRRQQVFSFLYMGEVEAPAADRIERVEEDLERLQELSERVDRLRLGASGMVEAIVDEVGENEGEAYLIFTAFRASAEMIFDALRRRDKTWRVGLVTGEDARATGLGRIGADEVVERFMGSGSSKMRRHERLRVLVATDCLSEGVNLQRCSRLILADLPYSPVRLEQRIGRIARPGSVGDSVMVYLPRPLSWADSLGMRRRLGERLDLAQAMGAGHGLARAVSGDGGGDESGAGPLAAMTLEERLWQQVRGDEGGPEFGRVEDLSGAGKEGLWVRVLVEGVSERFIWCWVAAGAKKPVVRLSEQLGGLARLSDDERDVVAWEPVGAGWEVVRAWMRRRRDLFEAARLAPPLLGRGAEALRLWRRLERAVDSGALEATKEEMERRRATLLCAHPSGIVYEMRELLEAEPSGAQVARFVAGLADAPLSRPVRVRAVAALGL